MPDWLIWVVIAAVLSGCGRGCGWGVRRYRGLQHGDADEGRVDSPKARRRLTRGSRPVGTPLQALQREFVNGAITMEQYEAEIDKLEHLV